MGAAAMSLAVLDCGERIEGLTGVLVRGSEGAAVRGGGTTLDQQHGLSADVNCESQGLWRTCAPVLIDRPVGRLCGTGSAGLLLASSVQTLCPASAGSGLGLDPAFADPLAERLWRLIWLGPTGGILRESSS